jgi:hypothetical protein
MSLTQDKHVFAGVHENGINTFLHALFSARPHYLRYGTSMFVPTTTVSATNVAPIPFPGVPGGIPYQVRFAIPHIDLFPPDAAPGPLPPGPGQFSIRTRVQLTVGCGHWHVGRDQHPTFEPISTELEVWARGRPWVQNFGPGSGQVGIEIDDITIVGIAPNTLAAVLECLIRMMLQAALDNVRLPFHALTMGAFALILQRGPEIADDQIELFGDV